MDLKDLSTLLSKPALVLLIVLGFVPILYPLAARYEGEVDPVVRNVVVEELRTTDSGLMVDVHFDKVRSCEFLGISWYNQIGGRVPVQFNVKDSELPLSRPVRDDQNAGPWHLIGMDTLDESVAITSHRCHPFWITFTKFYP